MSLKFTGEFCIMTMKNDAKFEEEFTFQFKLDMRNLASFDQKHSKISKICPLMGCFSPKYIMPEPKKGIESHL